MKMEDLKRGGRVLTVILFLDLFGETEEPHGKLRYPGRDTNQSTPLNPVGEEGEEK
jgi:hypothetical protein